MNTRLGRPPLPLRTHLLGIVLLGAILPLALIGWWLTYSATRSGRALLEVQLDASLAAVRHSVNTRWDLRRGDLLLLAQNEVVRQMLARGSAVRSDSAFLSGAAGAMADAIPRFEYRDRQGDVVLSLDAARTGTGGAGGTNDASRAVMSLSYPVLDKDSAIGTMEAQLFLEAVLPADSARLMLPGSALALRDHRRGEVLVALTDSVAFPESEEVVVAGTPWLARRARFEDPPFELAILGPLEPYVAPFERDGVAGLAALLAVTLGAVTMTAVLTSRLAQSIRGLADTAGAVASGDLNHQAVATGPLELHRLAGSFNTMTVSLRRMVAELSERRALAAVGEFAAALAHEVRNALTSIQIDLERVEERTDDVRNRALVSRTVAHVRRLDAAVTGSLRIARSGRVAPADVDLAELLQATIVVAEPTFTASGSSVELVATTVRPIVSGDAEALQQLFLNLLLNAQQAMSAPGKAEVIVRTPGGRVQVLVRDAGQGMTAEEVDHAFDPYFTTRPKGTGLGLPIARQIAAAHGGTLSISSAPGAGTTVEVILPVRAG